MGSRVTIFIAHEIGSPSINYYGGTILEEGAEKKGSQVVGRLYECMA